MLARTNQVILSKTRVINFALKLVSTTNNTAQEILDKLETFVLYEKSDKAYTFMPIIG